MKPSFNELPPKTKECMVSIKTLYKKDHKKWQAMYQKLPMRENFGAAAGLTYRSLVYHISNTCDLRDMKVDVKVWAEVLRAFNLWNDELKLELMPFALGGEE